MGIVKEFRKFIMRGNLVDLAIGFTVGAAFTTVAKSLVNDIIMPPIGLLLGNVDFKDLFFILRQGDEELPPYATIETAQAAGAVTLNYGQFINNCLALVIVAIVMFFIIKLVNRVDDALEREVDTAKQPGERAEKKCPFCLTTIPFRATRCPQCTSQLASVEATDTKVTTAPSADA